jgi:hypothetical protein
MYQIPAYVELSFGMPFYDLYFEGEWESTARNTKHLDNICTLLNIKINSNWLYELYGQIPINKGDIYVWHSANDAQQFILLNLYKPPTDQMAMITLGIRTTSNNVQQLREIIYPLYLNNPPRTCISEDYFNNQLLKLVTGSVEDGSKIVNGI